MIQLRQEVLEQAFECFRHCGEGERECVVYLTGPVGTPGLVDGLIHPRHAASIGHYDVDCSALGELAVALLKSRRSVRVQAHTHPRDAYHSSVDDAAGLVGSPGSLSLVIPGFALGAIGLDRAFLAERTQRGDWAPVALRDRLEVVA